MFTGGCKKRAPETGFVLVTALSILFFAGCFLLGDHRLSEDWYSYYTLSIIREPGYALFVRACLDFFGQDAGLHVIALLQNLLAAFSVCFCATRLPRILKMTHRDGSGVSKRKMTHRDGSDASKMGDSPGKMEQWDGSGVSKLGDSPGKMKHRDGSDASKLGDSPGKMEQWDGSGVSKLGDSPENDAPEPSRCVKNENDAPEPSRCVKNENDAPEPSRCVKNKNDAPEPSRCVKIGKMMPLLVALLLLMPHAATPLGSNTHLILTNTVMAESICLSLFYLYMIPLTSLVTRGPSPKEAAKAYLLGLLMCQFRGQMMVTFILTSLVLMAGVLPNIKKIAVTLAAMVTAFAVNSLVGGCYQYAVNGYFAGKALGPANMACNLIYETDESAAAAISDPGERELFLAMHRLAVEKQLHLSFAPAGVIEGEAHYSACHDRINYEIFEPLVQDFLKKNGVNISDYALYRIEADKVGSRLFKALLLPGFGAWLSTYLKVCAVGFIRTVAVVHPLLNWYTILVYGLACFLTVTAFFRRSTPGDTPAARRLRSDALFMVTVLVSIAGMVCSTALIIECWSRYVFYNMPFFYLGIVILLKDLWLARKK